MAVQVHIKNNGNNIIRYVLSVPAGIHVDGEIRLNDFSFFYKQIRDKKETLLKLM